MLRGRGPCGERVRCPTILSKIVDKTPDDRGGNRGKPWSIEMLVSFNALCDYWPSLCSTNVRGRRLALATTALMSPAMHRRTAFGGKSLDLLIKRARVLRRAGVIDSSPLMTFVERHLGRNRYSKVLIQRSTLRKRTSSLASNRIK